MYLFPGITNAYLLVAVFIFLSSCHKRAFSHCLCVQPAGTTPPVRCRILFGSVCFKTFFFPFLILDDNNLKKGQYLTVSDLCFGWVIAPVCFVQATLRFSTRFSYILPRYYQVSEDMQYIAFLQMLYLYCNTLAPAALHLR